VQHAWYLEQVRQLGAPPVRATGALEQRIAQVLDWIVKGFAPRV
jgi:hypothetical protein